MGEGRSEPERSTAKSQLLSHSGAGDHCEPLPVTTLHFRFCISKDERIELCGVGLCEEGDDTKPPPANGLGWKRHLVNVRKLRGRSLPRSEFDNLGEKNWVMETF